MTVTTSAAAPPVADAARLRLLQLASPTLPVGAFAYSAGLETAVERGWVHDRASAAEWIGEQLGHGIARLDLPLLRRMQTAWAAGNTAQARAHSTWLLACRETAELRAQERHLGGALATLLADIGEPALAVAAGDLARTGADASFALLFALAAAHWDIDPQAACEGYGFSWLEAQCAAAVRLVPLGQTDGQRLLLGLAARLPDLAAEAALCDDAGLAFSAPALSVASSMHETQYSRLFRS